MIEVRIPNEIKRYKETWYFGLNIRQMICVGIALILNIPLFLYYRNSINPDLLGYLVIGITCIFGSIGFFEYNGMKFEKFVWVWLKFRFTPQLRLYKTYTFYEFAEMQKRRERR